MIPPRRVPYVALAALLVAAVPMRASGQQPAARRLAQIVGEVDLRPEEVRRASRLQLPGQRVLERLRVEERPANDFTWVGTVSGVPGSLAALRTTRSGLIGLAISPQEVVRIEPSGRSVHRVSVVPTQADVRDLDLPFPQTPTSVAAQGKIVEKLLDAAKALWCPPTSTCHRVDVLLMFTAGAATEAGDSQIVCDNAMLALDLANGSFSFAKMKVRLRPVSVPGGPACLGVAPPDDSSYDEYLEFLKAQPAGSGPPFVSVAMDSAKADVGVLLTENDPSACGKATVNAAKANAFAVVNQECAAPWLSFAHEVGHVLGAQHHVCPPSQCGSQAQCDAFHCSAGQGTRAYWLKSPNDQAMTIMAWGRPIRVGRWSTLQSQTDGVILGDAPYHENRKTILEGAKRVKKFR